PADGLEKNNLVWSDVLDIGCSFDHAGIQSLHIFHFLTSQDCSVKWWIFTASWILKSVID
ncbi:MAG: hypothetical protein WA151_18545, partial [Desulfatirhabdiaceae bacterium]